MRAGGPNDEDQADQLDILYAIAISESVFYANLQSHHISLLVLDGELHLAPIPENPMVSLPRLCSKATGN